jgi:hypothetical protein
MGITPPSAAPANGGPPWPSGPSDLTGPGDAELCGAAASDVAKPLPETSPMGKNRISCITIFILVLFAVPFWVRRETVQDCTAAGNNVYS